MTLDEAIEMYTSNAEYERTHGNLQGCLEFRQLTEWLKDYKRLKEQEPCEDAISREAVCDYIAEFINHEYSTQSECEMVDSMIDGIQHMPSVKLQEQKTVLYSGDGYADGCMVYDMAECPNCGRKFEYGDETWNCNFCPDCGQALNWERSE